MSSLHHGPDDLLGRAIAGYRLDRVIGTGASGAVYLAFPARRRRGDAPVAVKVLGLPWQLSTQARGEFRARFQREADVLKRLSHPHILRLIDYGEQDGFHYMVLPYMAGGTLARPAAARTGPLPAGEAARLALQLADAVDYAHRQGVIHRDIKPANVLLDGAGNAFLADFSIARLIEETTANLTRTGQVIGTDAYMAPEQRAGKDAGPAADIYSLGAVLYELVTGQRAQAQNATTPAGPLVADLPPAAGEALARALAQVPQDRFQSATAFMKAFARGISRADLLAERPTLMPGTLPPTRVVHYPSHAWSRPLSKPKVLSAAFAATLIVGLLTALLAGEAGVFNPKPRTTTAGKPETTLTGTRPSGTATTSATGTASGTGTPTTATPNAANSVGPAPTPNAAGTPPPAATTPPTTNRSWSGTGSMATTRVAHSATVLQNGKVLVAGGRKSGVGIINFTEIYDPTTGTWSQTGNLNTPRLTWGHSLVTLASGKALITGGSDYTASIDYASTELYDPSTGIWTPSGNLNTPRRGAAMVLLQDSRVLVAAGSHGPPDCCRFLATSEIYDPATGTWTYTKGNLTVARDPGGMVLLHDGRALIAGGEGPWMVSGNTAEIFDPATGLWSSAGTMPWGWGGASMTVLNDGRVLVAGGWNGSTFFSNSALYNPSTNSWTPTGSLLTPRSGHSATLLADGRVLIAGGNNGLPALQTTEIYDPSSGTWSAGPNLTGPRGSPIAVVLANGSTMLIGGFSTDPETVAGNLATCELLSGFPAQVAVATAHSTNTSASDLILSIAQSADIPQRKRLLRRG